MSDTIYKEDAIRAVAEVLSLNRFASFKNIKDFGRFAERMLRNVPSADRPQGEWIEQEDDYHHYWECSECGMGVGLDDIRNYCPNCGAKMKGADDDNA